MQEQKCNFNCPIKIYIVKNFLYHKTGKKKKKKEKEGGKEDSLGELLGFFNNKKEFAELNLGFQLL